SSDDQRTLHSFPTRRSSDLERRAAAVVNFKARRVRLAPDDSYRVDRNQATEVNDDPLRVPRVVVAGEVPVEVRVALPERARVARSEEHMSELQSRSDLVCRL